ncbi:ABC transporter ATP-binding protein [Amycolatopsis rubida]|uniref:ABC transporter ATP-binding protein n=1 Tax=Amycolatopsis rubida TaxID=112413 RepID=A0ABX0CDI2_9PSEU|nr:ABC transporter ATP-binding protein [Amycolatopsis rubida]MYW98043.1 ATP-binding cassette domain-containing protein [Amycolatopsis rubida]NEC63028.1 ABC transporter ATP-binding protein [Amycolatopsis rubida]
MTQTGAPAGPDPAAEVLLPTATAARTRQAAWRVLRPHRGLAAATLLVLVLATAVGLLAPRLLGGIVDLVVRGDGTAVLPIAAALALVALAQGGFQALGSAMVARLGQTAIAGVRETVVRKVLRIPAERVERAGSGDVLARLSGDVEAVNEAVGGVLPTLIDAGLAIVFTAAALVLLDWRFAVAALLAVPFQIAAVRWYLRVAVPVIARERVAEGARAQQLLDSIDGAATVRALRVEAEHLSRVAAASDRARKLSIRMAAVQRRFFGRLNYGELAGLAAILATGFLLVRSGTATLGAASAAALYFHRLFDQFNAILGSFDSAQAASGAFARLVGVADLPDPPRRAPRPSTSDRTVTVSGLSFAYDAGRPVLSEVDLTVGPGERLAIVGASGAGKTTLVKVIAGVLDAERGRVELGGVDTARHDTAELRRKCVLLSQEVHVFADTLAANLGLARADAAEDEMTAALAEVGAAGWFAALPDGLSTVLGRGGHPLTPAQAQQLALARLVLADPPIAILDEATAEAGSTGAKVLEAAADKALAGRTALVVAHRLTQAARADRIVVLEHGRVAEVGTHAELVAAGGGYAGLWRAWSANR